MKTSYKHIYFEKSLVTPQIWLCKNRFSQVTIAQLYFYPKWKQYVIAPARGTTFNKDCLENIIDFLNQLNEEIR